MRTFTDTAGRTWTLAITVDAIKRVQGLVKGVNLADLTAADTGTASPLITKLATDIVLLCDVIYAVIKPQADQLKVTDEQFGQGLGGDVIAAASDAFWEELADFFRKLRRLDQARAVEKQQTLIHAAVRAVDQRIDALDVDKLVEKAFTQSAETPSGTATSSPASSGSTQGPTP